MFKFICVTGAFALLYILSNTNANMDGGPGLWHVFSVVDCERDLDQVLLNLTVKKHKHNRTHDVYDASLDVHETIGIDGDGILIEICKHTDGGCKQVQVISDENVGRFAEKYAKKNMEDAFTMGGIDPPNFPVKPGSYAVQDFYFDRCEMPKDALYGEFTGVAFIVRGAAKIGCVKAHVQFRDEDDNECVYEK